ncbi:MAG: helix-turn-helix transcriptional regulator [Oscillospiraceae bacterium]|nr:helix-turn-helix transcriptional regulator [Oscillospiraceae bacterium]MDY3218077.1 helix-turn-helix transcriptional regulator [Candidatus Fimivivens sp.]
MYEIFAKLLEQKGVTPYQVYKATGVAQSSLSDWKNGKSKPKYEKMVKIADYFGVTVDYLLGKPEQKEKAPALTKKDERDIEKRLEAMIGDLEGNADGLMFSGEPMDEETRELLKMSLRNQLEISKRLAKQKYTPKKYRKEGE